jgi:hypothetical protein
MLNLKKRRYLSWPRPIQVFVLFSQFSPITRTDRALCGQPLIHIVMLIIPPLEQLMSTLNSLLWCRLNPVTVDTVRSFCNHCEIWGQGLHFNDKTVLIIVWLSSSECNGKVLPVVAECYNPKSKTIVHAIENLLFQ